jgi:hypothetical protein
MGDSDRLRAELRTCTEDIERLLSSDVYANVLSGTASGLEAGVEGGAAERVRAEQTRIGRRIAEIRAELRSVGGSPERGGLTTSSAQ